jgi:hypothetical protein
LPKIAGKRVNPTSIHWTALNDSLLMVAFDNGAIRFTIPSQAAAG